MHADQFIISASQHPHQISHPRAALPPPPPPPPPLLSPTPPRFLCSDSSSSRGNLGDPACAHLNSRLFLPEIYKSFQIDLLLGPNSFWSDNTSNSSSSPRNTDTEHKRSYWEKKKIESVGIGLGIVDALKDESFDPKQPKTEARPVVIFGSKLKIQVPSLPFSVPPNPESASPRSPPNFGIKSRNSQLGFASPRISRSPDTKSRSGSSSNSRGLGVPGSPQILSASEMELSEDYTCVISHGPNPKTTHIFDDCIVESCCGVFGDASDLKENGFLSDEQSSGSLSQSFLSFCCTCKKNLGQGSDIYMYRERKLSVVESAGTRRFSWKRGWENQNQMNMAFLDIE
ncbi:hypothetical protein NL676_029569 [Syzygium grande]|nr:hypothetical protein NL676_029569 [Syzygium grande]